MNAAPRWLGLMVVYAAVVAMALLVVQRAEAKRALVDAIERELKTQDLELVDYRYLLIERASLSAFHDVEVTALAQGMRYPDDLRRVSR